MDVGASRSVERVGLNALNDGEFAVGILHGGHVAREFAYNVGKASVWVKFGVARSFAAGKHYRWVCQSFQCQRVAGVDDAEAVNAVGAKVVGKKKPFIGRCICAVQVRLGLPDSVDRASSERYHPLVCERTVRIYADGCNAATRIVGSYSQPPFRVDPHIARVGSVDG